MIISHLLSCVVVGIWLLLGSVQAWGEPEERTVPNGHVNVELSGTLDNFRRESKIRAAFWGIKVIKQGTRQLELLNKYGFTTALVNDSRYAVKEQLWPLWGQAAEQYGIDLFPIHTFAGTDEKRVWQGLFRPYVDRHGALLSSTPCPLDEEYWNRSIGQRFLKLAHISNTASIRGLLFDTEMYGSEVSVYREACFCDVCWQQFFDERRLSPDKTVTQDQRYTYLSRQQMLSAYTAFQEERLSAILSEIEQQVHAVNPDLLLGFLAYLDNWFYRGLIRGIGTLTHPALVFTESTYIYGYTPHVHTEQATIWSIQKSPLMSDLQPIARYIPGVWLGRFFPEDLTRHAYHLATHTAGFWIFSAGSLWEGAEHTGHYTLHGTPQAYWQALQRANHEIEQFSRSDGMHQSQLSGVPLSSYYDDGHQRLSTPSTLKSFLHDVALSEAQFSSPAKLQYRGETLFHGFRNPFLQGNNRAKQAIRITHVPLGSYTDATMYQLFDADGILLQEGQLNQKSRTKTLTLPTSYSGLFSLLINSGSNLSTVNFTDLPFVIEASPTFALWTFRSPYVYEAYSQADTQAMKLRAYCSSVEESAIITIRASDSDGTAQAEIVEYTEIRATVEEPATTFRKWDISVASAASQRFEDVVFSLYDQEYPYLLLLENTQDRR